MSDKITEAMTLALEALEYDGLLKKRQAIAALRKALTQRRKPLTDEKIQEIGETYTDELWINDGWSLQFARAIEAAHGIKEPTHA